MSEMLVPCSNISHYRIVSKLGAGGMGEVWLAEDTRLERKVALKILPSEFTKDANRVRRFMQEAKAASALNHPNIITVYDIGECEAGRFIVMELVDGRTLRSVIAADNSLENVLSLGSQMARALSAAHAAGITHRDIKPDNIMVRDDGYVKVLDFGLARLLPTGSGEDAATLAQQTTPGMIMGTVAYMSPEQARGQSASPPSDIFALGIVLYELLSGQNPFSAETLVGYLHAITLQSPPPPGRSRLGIPTALDELILRMLQKEARRRPIASEVAEALREIERQTEQRAMGIKSTARRTVVPLRHTVGRKQERKDLRAAFDQANAGRGSLVCVAGEPGIGKTTLAEDFLAELATNENCTIARGRCSERLAGTEAYLPLLEALDTLVRDDPKHASKMRQLAPTWFAQVASVSDDETRILLAEVKAASQERMKRELAAFLQAVARAQPLVIFFDDLHWADVSTIDVLSFLASRFEAMRVLIVVTYRPSDMLLSKHPFLQIKPDLQTRGACRELMLEFLSEADIADYLALEFAGHCFPAEFPKLIHARTEGSPLFLADLVRYLRDRGVIALEDSSQDVCAPKWMLARALPDIEGELPESVRGMIERKIAQLSEEDRRLLTAASVQGHEFDSAVVGQVLKLDANEIEERLEKLERIFAFVKLASESVFPNRTLTLKYRFVHVLYQNALYASLRATRKATLSRNVAQALEGYYGERKSSVANELAQLWETAREFSHAADYSLQAARNAAQVHAHQEAAQFAERGLKALQELPETPERNERELALQLALGFSLQSLLSWAAPEAKSAFTRARKLCEQMGNDPRFFAALVGVWAYNLVRAQYEAAHELCGQMLQLAEKSQDPVFLVTATMCWAKVHYYQADFVSTRQLGERALALDRREHHEAYLSVYNEDGGISARREHSFCMWLLGYPDRALSLALEAVAIAEQTSHPFSLAAAYHTVGSVFSLFRDWQSGRIASDKVFALSEEHALGDMLRHATSSNALNLAYQEPTAEAIESAKHAIESLDTQGVMLSRTRYVSRLGEAFQRAGRCAEGFAAISEALALVELHGERMVEAEIWRIKGDLFLKSASDNWQAEAESCFHKAIEIAQRQSAKSWELRATISLARLWHQQGRVEEARQTLAEIYNWFTEGFDTPDLRDAKALLEELRQRVGTGGISDSVTEESKASPSIAVLPFVNISNDPENEYFCDGLAEELLNALSKINALRVAARTSSFSFKGKETDIREIGQKLNVSAVLEGSVRKAGNRLRITAQLINVSDGYHLWSERYDRELEDIFDIQDEITLAIVDALKVKLLGAEKAVVTRYTDNTEAYQLYLLGRFHYSKYTEDGYRKSIEYYERAIAIESNYAPAFASMAMSYLGLLYYGYMAPSQSVAKMRSAADKALALDPWLAESHYVLADLKAWFDWDWSAAEREFKRTLELNPNLAEAHEQYSVLLSLTGQPGRALAEAARALELAPLSLQTNLNVGWTFWFAGQPQRMLEQGRKLIELEPNFFGGHWLMGTFFWLEGKYDEAVTLYETALALGGGPQTLAFLGCLYGLFGNREQAQLALDKLQPSGGKKYAPRFDSALIHAGLGEWNRAFELFEEAYDQREGVLVCFKHVASLVPGLSDDTRLTHLLRRIGVE